VHYGFTESGWASFTIQNFAVPRLCKTTVPHYQTANIIDGKRTERPHYGGIQRLSRVLTGLQNTAIFQDGRQKQLIELKMAEQN
jgi:hypothetical protein